MGYFIFSEKEHARYSFRRTLIGFLLGALSGVLVAAAISDLALPEEIIDPRMERACVWPRLEGEMTVVTVHQGRILCWRWR